MFKMMTVFGTRPEAIKLAPILQAADNETGIDSIVVSAGQHGEMLNQVLRIFDVQPRFDLQILSSRQSLTEITTRVLDGVEKAIMRFEPHVIVVQGDTTTSVAAALAGYYAKIPVVHVEAGLRTGNKYSPFPEEINRRITSQIAELHLAPTGQNKRNLIAEGIDPSTIRVTGNTAIDALQRAVDSPVKFSDPMLSQLTLDASEPVLLVTTHRRENLGPAMSNIAEAIAELADRFSELKIVIPMHKNPAVREVLLSVLGEWPNVMLVEPLDYVEFVNLMKHARAILTDSGGVQEEAPFLNVPVLVMRDATERTEAVAAGAVKLVGTAKRAIVEGVVELLTDARLHASMSVSSKLYGDGMAAKRSIRAIIEMIEG